MEFLAYAIIFFGTINLIRMGVFLIGSDLYEFQRERALKRAKYNGSLPKFTVVIPAYNEAGSIVSTVKSVLASDYPMHKLQVVVVNDGSTDNTKEVLKAYKKKEKPKNVKIVHQKNQGKAVAMNNGIKKYATGKLVMCLDADSSVSPDALKKASRYFRNERVMALASNVRIKPNGTFLNLIQRFEYLVCYQMKRAQSVFNIEYIIGGIGSTFRRSFLKKINYYDGDTITEDIDLTMKILQHGGKDHRVIYGSDVITYTESVMSVKDLMKQRFRWKWGRSQTFYKNFNLFFNTDTKHSKWLTCVYLPYALFSDIAFFLEPFMIGYILYIVALYQDIYTLLSALLVITLYLSLNVLLETTLSKKDKLMLLPLAPSMFFFFYILSYVEYYALLKTLVQLPRLKKSVEDKICSWTHVERQTRVKAA